MGPPPRWHPGTTGRGHHSIRSFFPSWFPNPNIGSGGVRSGGPPRTLTWSPLRAPGPVRHRPCGYIQIYHTGPNSAYPQSSGEFFPPRFLSQFIYVLLIHAEHHGTPWSPSGAGRWWWKLPSRAPPPGLWCGTTHLYWGGVLWYPTCTPPPNTLSQTQDVWSKQQSFTWKGQGFPLPALPQSSSSSVLPASLMGP